MASIPTNDGMGRPARVYAALIRGTMSGISALNRSHPSQIRSARRDSTQSLMTV
jgi:hypothetical protein